MKSRIVILILCLVIAIAVCSCSKNDKKGNDSNNSNVTETERPDVVHTKIPVQKNSESASDSTTDDPNNRDTDMAP